MKTRDIYRRAEEVFVARQRLHPVACTCGWDNGDHAPECDLERAWDRAFDFAQGEAEDAESDR